MISDWECLRRAQKGDETAWQSLLKRFHSKLIAIVLLITGCPAAAKDLAQETFVRILSVEIRHERGSVGGLLATIAYRLAIKEKKRQYQHSTIEDKEITDPAASPLNSLILEERDRQIAEVIRSLSPEQRDVLLLRFYGGHSYEEIAELTGVPIGTVKSRIFYAVKACQKNLLEKGILE